MKKIITTVLAIFGAVAAKSQDLPSINQGFDVAAHSARTKLMSDPQVSFDISRRLLRDSDKITVVSQHADAVAIAAWLGCEALLSLNRPHQALALVGIGLRYQKLVSQPVLIGRLLLARGGSYSRLKDVKRALGDYQTAFRIFDTLSESRDKSIALQYIGTIYQNAGDYRAALKYAYDALDIYSKDPSILVTNYNNIGNSLIELGQYGSAIHEYDRAFAAAHQLNSPLAEVRILQNRAQAETEAGKYAAADATLAQAFAIANTGPAASWKPALFGVSAMLAMRKGDLDEAAALIDRTFEGARDAQAAMPMRDFHRTAYEIFRRRGETAKALDHLEAFKELDDEQRAVAASASAALMTARFDFANQDAKIKTLQLARERVQTRLRTTIIGGLLAAVTVISTLLAIGFVSIRRSRNQVRVANEELTGTNAALEKAIAAKSEFLATTSHEIRTPLNGILGMTQVMLADRAVPDALRTRIELVHGAGETMRALVDDILDVAKMETGELRIFPAEMNLRRLLEDAAIIWTGQAQTKRIAIDLDLAGCPEGIVADEVRLRQIIFNLMSNAIKFTDRGQVGLAVTTRDAAGGERIAIAVTDTGIGIPDDRLADIFESFRQVDGGTTRRHGGTGLGLAICRNLARAMGGDVVASSILGTGSTFTLDLPLDRIEAPQFQPAVHNAATRLGAAELLVLDANPLAQGILRALLAPHAKAVRFAAHIDEAEAMLAAGGIDHVVVDGVAIALDVAAAERLASRAHESGARLTLLWPKPEPETIEALRAHGVEHVLAKPLPAGDLLAALQIVYDARAASRDIAA